MKVIDVIDWEGHQLKVLQQGFKFFISFDDKIILPVKDQISWKARLTEIKIAIEPQSTEI